MPLTAESLIAKATEQTGLDDFDLPDALEVPTPEPTNPGATIPTATATPTAPTSAAIQSPWRQALDTLLHSATAESHLNPTGEFMLEAQLETYLRNRLLMLDWARSHPCLLYTSPSPRD